MKSPFEGLPKWSPVFGRSCPLKKGFLNCLFPLKDRTWRRGLVCHLQGRNEVEDSRRSLRELTHGVPQESPRKGSKQKQ